MCPTCWHLADMSDTEQDWPYAHIVNAWPQTKDEVPVSSSVQSEDQTAVLGIVILLRVTTQDTLE